MPFTIRRPKIPGAPRHENRLRALQKYWAHDSAAAHRRAAAAWGLGTGDSAALEHAHAVQRWPARFGFFA